MDNLDLGTGDSPEPKHVVPNPTCILCQKENTSRKALGRGRRKYCNECKAKVPAGYHVCVHGLHEGERVMPVGMFHSISRTADGVSRYYQSYCKLCVGKPQLKETT